MALNNTQRNICQKSILVLFFFLFIATGFGCAGTEAQMPAQNSGSVQGSGMYANTGAARPEMAECWRELSVSLAGDGLDREWVEDVFARLGSCYTDKPMKTKLSELYKIKFGKQKPAKEDAEKNRQALKNRYYRNVVTERNAKKAEAFLDEHMTVFQRVEESSGVPKEIAVSLLLVETDLGSYLGKGRALTNLASMAASKKSSQFYPHLPTVKGDKEKEEWMRTILEKRSDWAYGELKALLEYSYVNRIDPLTLSGSIYGAIGYCQFMPSNVMKFGVDANNDGVIDLFDLHDAIASLSNYLKEAGWKIGLDEDGKRKVLLEYNRSIAYANTIIMMADKLKARQRKHSAYI